MSSITKNDESAFSKIRQLHESQRSKLLQQRKIMIEQRNELIEQDEKIVQSQKKIDEWFNAKTRGLNDFQKSELKKKWGTMQKVLSSHSRIEKVVNDIIFDFSTKPRLSSERGNAILIASSIYEASAMAAAISASFFSSASALAITRLISFMLATSYIRPSTFTDPSPLAYPSSKATFTFLANSRSAASGL